MAVKVVHVSDVSDREGSQEELGTLEVLEHPEIGEPARLEIFPDEFERLQAADRIVRLRWTAPGSRRPQELTVLQETFDDLAQDRDMKRVLLSAITAQHERRGQTQAPRRPRRGGGADGRRGKVDYSSPEHAGEPHRGRITEAEKSYVREHLDQVNRRLRGKGMRTIDPADPTMRERYGLAEQIRY
jgi:hypothetical protein